MRFNLVIIAWILELLSTLTLLHVLTWIRCFTQASLQTLMRCLSPQIGLDCFPSGSATDTNSARTCYEVVQISIAWRSLGFPLLEGTWHSNLYWFSSVATTWIGIPLGYQLPRAPMISRLPLCKKLQLESCICKVHSSTISIGLTLEVFPRTTWYLFKGSKWPSVSKFSDICT